MSCWADKLPISTHHIVSSSLAVPISSPSPFWFSEGHWEETGSCWGPGERQLQPEASGQAGATSGGVAVDVGIHVIYRTQALALICIQSLAVTWRWSPRPPLTLPWADQMLDVSNSCFRSMCFKKKSHYYLLGSNDCLGSMGFYSETVSWELRPMGRAMPFSKHSRDTHRACYSRGTRLW